jgi:predicted GNAT family acetyltransferase
MAPSSEPTVRRTEDRYELVLDGRIVGVCDADDDGERVVLPHVEVDPALRGQGLAGTLVRAVLADLRDRGRRAVPVCPYVVDYVARHPDELPG